MKTIKEKVKKKEIDKILKYSIKDFRMFILTTMLKERKYGEFKTSREHKLCLETIDETLNYVNINKKAIEKELLNKMLSLELFDRLYDKKETPFSAMVKLEDSQ